MTLKNIYGFLGGRRNVFHQDINGIVTELAQVLKPTLCILDGTVTMMTNGPTGGSLSDLKETGTMVVSTDPVAADAVGVELLGRLWLIYLISRWRPRPGPGWRIISCSSRRC